jgi:purine nucleoside permease
VEKMVGGQHDADVARVAQKLDALRAQIMQSVVDSTKSGLDSALENLKAAQSSVQSFVQRWTEVANNIASR